MTQLGFPIRTPPDHSSVANSPGLIAGSYVLHRLLMPRHPPCALHSLSQQRHKHTHAQTHTPHTTRHTHHKKQQPTHPQSKDSRPHNVQPSQEKPDHTNLQTHTNHIARQAPHSLNRSNTHQHTRAHHRCECCRCSRPLCRSQTTTPPTPTHHPHRHARRQREDQNNQTPTRRSRPGRPDSSGPNSVLDPIPHQPRQQVSTPTAGQPDSTSTRAEAGA